MAEGEKLTTRVERLEAKVAALEAAAPSNLAELVAAEVERVAKLPRTAHARVQEMRTEIELIEDAIGPAPN